MKSIFVILIALLLFAVPMIQAEETTPNPATPIIQTVFDELALSLEIDTLYSLREGVWKIGAGAPLAIGWDGMVEIRAEIASDFNADATFGLGIGTDIVKVLGNYMPEMNWVAKVNPKIGFILMPDFNERINSINDFDLLCYINLIKREF